LTGGYRRRQGRDWPTLPIPFFAFQEIYEQLARREWDPHGKLPDFEFADVPLILSALGHPFVTIGGRPAYPTVPAKAAALFRGLVKNHGLRDGNKRLAVTVMTVFLLANGWIPGYTNGQLYRYALRIARHHGNYPVEAIERWIRRHCELADDVELEELRARHKALYESGDLVEASLQPVTRQPRR